jgi:ubiquinol-cytochrome c reductase iron-sulfur subunit
VTDVHTPSDAGPVAGGADGHEGDGHDAEHRTPVALPVARLSDPHMQPAARYPRRVEGIAGLGLLVGLLGVAAFGGAFWVDADPVVLGVTLSIGFLGLGFGLIAWGKYLMPQGPFVEDRHPLAGTEQERTAMSAALVQRTGVVVRRRGLLGGLLAAGLAVFGIVALFPLVRSLGPVPDDIFGTSNWRRGDRLVDSNNRPVRADTLQVGGIMTVFPEGRANTEEGQAVDQTVLIRVSLDDFTTQPGRETWGPHGYVAYSKLCTHLGCPVGLYEQQLQLLVCPCHQSMFNVLNGAVPQFGPAPRPLPQLPLKIEGGYLVAQKGYDQPLGPGYWTRS